MTPQSAANMTPQSAAMMTPISADWTFVQLDNRERSESICSSYTYNSGCTEDAWLPVSATTSPSAGQRKAHVTDFVELLTEELSPPSSSREQLASFFSASWPLDLQLHVATWLSSVEALNALDATCQWVRRSAWSMGRATVVEHRSLVEAAAATLLVRYGFETSLAATTTTAPYAKRLALARAAVVVPPRGKRALVATSATASRMATPQSIFTSPTEFRVAAESKVLGLVELAGPPDGPSAWRAFLLDVTDSACHLAFPSHHGWTNVDFVKRLPFPVRDHPREDHQSSSSSSSSKFARLQRLDRHRWASLLLGEEASEPPRRLASASSLDHLWRRHHHHQDDSYEDSSSSSPKGVNAVSPSSSFVFEDVSDDISGGGGGVLLAN